jgi:hypothetical protein
MYVPYSYIIHFSSYCIVAVKEAPIKLALSKWYMLPAFCLCLYVHVSSVCPFPCDYTNIGLRAVELLKMNHCIIIIIIDV